MSSLKDFPKVLQTLTPTEKNKIEKLWKKVQINHPDFNKMKKSFWLNELTIYRHLFSHNYNLRKSEKSLNIDIKWRTNFDFEKDINIDEIIEYLEKKGFEKLKFLYSYCKDKYNKPIIFAHAKAIEIIPNDEKSLKIKQHLILLCVENVVRNLENDNYQFTLIIDGSDIGLKFAKSLFIYGKMDKYFSMYFAERMYRGYIVNLRKGLNILWKIGRLFVDEKTYKKYIISSDNEILDEIVDKSKRNKVFGGSNDFEHDIIPYLKDLKRKRMEKPRNVKKLDI